MTNISYFDSLDTTTGQAIKWVLIHRGNDQFTSMPKEHWDKLEAEREQSGTL